MKADAGADEPEDPEGCYQLVKGTLLKTQETTPEKIIRVRGMWSNLRKKPNEIAKQWEANWQKHIFLIDEVGLGKSENELYLEYLGKIGKEWATFIRNDRRVRGEEGETRECRTWQECHFVF